MQVPPAQTAFSGSLPQASTPAHFAGHPTASAPRFGAKDADAPDGDSVEIKAQKGAPEDEGASDAQDKKAKSDEGPQNSRIKNTLALYKEYVVGKRWIGDIIWGSAIGLVTSLGTPLLAVTLSSAIATMIGISLTFRTISGMLMKPEGNFMQGMLGRRDAEEAEGEKESKASKKVKDPKDEPPPAGD